MAKYRGDNVFVSGKVLALPKLGKVKVKWSEDIPVFPNSATVTRTSSGKWFVSLQVDCKRQIKVKQTISEVGLDLGIHSFIATSNGDKIAPPRPYKWSKRKLKLLQRKLSKKSLCSKNRYKARLKVARLHQRIGNQRLDFLHKLSTDIVKEHLTVAIEDLCVRGMMTNKKLASAVADCGWSEFTRQLEYKSDWYERTLLKLPTFERSTGVCPNCLTTGDKLPLNVRNWTCDHCGAAHDRDIAAAQVILIKTTARSAGSKVCGLAQPPENNDVSREHKGQGEAEKAQMRLYIAETSAANSDNVTCYR